MKDKVLVFIYVQKKEIKISCFYNKMNSHEYKQYVTIHSEDRDMVKYPNASENESSSSTTRIRDITFPPSS